MKMFLLILMTLVGFPGAAYAQSVAGTWIGEAEIEIETGAAIFSETQTFTLVLEVDGTNLTGTLKRDERTVEISEGTVEESTISFKREAQSPFGAVPVPYDGQVNGDTLTLNVGIGAGFTVVLERQP